jgi:hypothetical protein
VVAARDLARFTLFTVIVSITTAGGWQSVDACSCVARKRTEIVPEPGAVGVPRNVQIRFTAAGSDGVNTENGYVGSYVLREVDESRNETEQIGTSQKMTGNRVVITPDHDLAPYSRYRLTVKTGWGNEEIVDFVTGGEPLRPMLGEFFDLSENLNTSPRVESVVSLAGRQGSAACEGHNQGYLITVRVPFQIDLCREHYDWLITEVGENGLSHAVQRSAIGIGMAKTQWTEQWQEHRLVVGHSQCESGPVPNPGSHAIVLSLVGLAEIAWTSEEIEMNVPEPPSYVHPAELILTPPDHGPLYSKC